VTRASSAPDTCPGTLNATDPPDVGECGRLFPVLHSERSDTSRDHAIWSIFMRETTTLASADPVVCRAGGGRVTPDV
jgi:hypothetical protein